MKIATPKLSKTFILTLSVITVFTGLSIWIGDNSRAATSGKMIMYLHKEPADANETYNALTLTKPEPGADTATATASTANTFNYSTGPTDFCQASTLTSNSQNQVVVTAATANAANTAYCTATFASMPVGQSISLSTSDAANITGQFWSSESATQAAVALKVFIYRWTGSGTTLSSSDKIASFSCAEPGTAATSCVPTAVAPANNITLAATDRIVVVTGIAVTTSRSGATASMYFDSTARAASQVTLRYTPITPNKPSLTGSMDDDFTTGTADTTCTTGGVAINTKWTCLQGNATSSTGVINEGDSSGTTGDTSDWLKIDNKFSANGTSSNFGTTPSNTFLYQPMPSAYGNGTIRTVANSSLNFTLASTNAASPYNHVGLVLWASNTDYLEVQLYADASVNGTANTVKVALNNSGTLSGATGINSSASNGLYNRVWLGFSNTGGSWQAQYSTNGTTWNNIGSAVSHGIFSRTGLNAYTALGSVSGDYAGAFEWFQSNLATATHNQTSYRFFANADSTTPGSALALQNTPYTLTSIGQQFRIRQLLKANGDVGVYQEAITPNTIYNGLPNRHFIAMGNDGYARIVYSKSNNDIVYTRCSNKACSSNSSTVIATAFNTDLSMTIGTDGFARIFDGSNLTFYQCTNDNCTSKNTTNVDTPINSAGGGSLIMGGDGFARLSYTNGTNPDLFYIRCTNSSCSTNVKTNVDNASSFANDTSLVVASDGFARIAYTDNTTGLSLAQCTNADCTTKNLTVVDSTGFSSPDAVMAGDGFARISYYSTNPDFTNGAKFVQCTNASCSTKNTSTIDANGAVGPIGNTSILIASDGFARFVYNKGIANGDPIYVTCKNASCSTFTTSDIDGSNNSADYPVLKLGSDGQPRVLYRDLTASILVLAAPRSQFNLQFAQSNTCSSASYSNVSSSSAIAFYDNPTPADDNSISSTGNDPTESGQTVVSQNYEEDDDFSSTSSWGNSQDAEWDFSVYDNGAPNGTSYCFRIVNGDGTSLSTYTNYPMITTFSPGPTMDRVMRGGNWFNNSGVEQSYYWAQ